MVGKAAAIAQDRYAYRPLYDDYFGGVSFLWREQYDAINGYSNRYWGWGGEDDDVLMRLRRRGYTMVRESVRVGRYSALDHAQAQPNPKRFELLRRSSLRSMSSDGLSSLRYTLRAKELKRLYTHVKVEIHPRGNDADEPK